MTSCFIKKGQLIAEYSTQSAIPTTRRLKPIYTSFAGEIRFENLLVRKIIQEKHKKVVKINQDDGILWITSGKIFALPKEINYKFLSSLNTNRSFAQLKLSSPYEGIIKFTSSSLSVITNELKITIDFLNLTKTLKNCTIKFFPLVKNYQYVDKYYRLFIP